MYIVKKEDRETMGINGTEAWGECWTVISSESGDARGVDALYVGFFVSEDEANSIANSLTRIAELEAALELEKALTEEAKDVIYKLRFG